MEVCEHIAITRLSEPELATHNDAAVEQLKGSYLLRMTAEGSKRVVERQ